MRFWISMLRSRGVARSGRRRLVESATRDLIGRYNAAWNAQALDAIVGMHTPDMVFHNHTAGERVEGSEQVRAHIAGIFDRYPDLHFQERALNCAEHFAACEWTASATLADERVAEWDGVDVFTVREGLIARKDVYSGSSNPRIVG
jgi:ketosteroid isomerase-like protein